MTVREAWRCHDCGRCYSDYDDEAARCCGGDDGADWRAIDEVDMGILGGPPRTVPTRALHT